MTTLVPFKAEHLSHLLSKQSVPAFGLNPDELDLNRLETAPHIYSVLSDDVPFLCGGVVEYWPGRGEAWAVFDPQCRNVFLSLHHIAKRFIEACPVRRIEAAVELDFQQGHRWVLALGFTLETPKARAFLPNAKDCSIYARVK